MSDQEVLHVARDEYLDTAKRLVDDGYTMCVDLTGADYLTYAVDRGLPAGVEPERGPVGRRRREPPDEEVRAGRRR